MSRRPADTLTLAHEPADLTAEEYDLFRRIVYEQSGINLGSQKQQLVRARLGKRMRAGNFRSYRAYYEHVKQDTSGTELCHLIDAISTNTTHLFRERQHFDFLAQTLHTGWVDHRPRSSNLRIWSAGCSSGEEPYSIAMTVDDALQSARGVDWRLLATDISTRMLAQAQAGRFDLLRLGTVPENFRRRYFERDAHAGPTDMVVQPALRQRIMFSHFNLMSARFPFRHGFDYIFCRNVMIYFDAATQTALVNRFAQALRPGGYLLIGHSESLNSLTHPLRYVRPTIYQRDPA